MWHETELGERLQSMRLARKISAYRLAKRSGVSLSHIRMIERAQRRPSPDTIAALCTALGLDAGMTAELRRLAGIDPDPASDPSSRAARAQAWPLLTYLLVNHVLLPRLTLADTLARLQRRPSRAAEYLTAAVSLSPWDFSGLRLLQSSPPRALLSLIEKNFGYLSATDLRRHHHTPRNLGRVRASILLLGLANPASSEYEALSLTLPGVFSEVFAARLFPLIYHQACRAWPFEKVYMPYALHGEACQRAVYAAARLQADVAGFDQVLLGRGAPMPRGQPSRPRLAPSGMSESSLREPPPDPVPPPGNPDYIFDHWDRCEFLERFPLLKLDLPASLKLALASDLPSVAALRLRFERLGVPAGVIADKLHCADGALETRVGSGPESFIARLVSENFRTAVEGLIFGAAWSEIVGAGRILGVDPRVLDLAESLAIHPASAAPPAAPSGSRSPTNPRS
jgi:transcriptional regulator with XRE-family HTH domain